MSGRPRLALVVAAPAVVALAAFALFWARQLPATATEAAAGMSLLPAGPGISCNSPVDPTICTAGGGEQFHVSIAVDSFPEGASGYVGFQTLLFYDDLTYKPTANAADELVWPDSALPLRSPANPTGTERTVGHGDLTAQTPPLEASSFLGNIVQVDLTCSDVLQTFRLALLVHDAVEQPLGSGFRLSDDDGGGTVAAKTRGQEVLDLDDDPFTDAQTVDVADSVQITCAGPTATPTPTPTPLPDLPDLMVQRASITLETGAACDFTTTTLGIRVFIANAGTVDAGPFAVDVNGVRRTVGGGLAVDGKTSVWFAGFSTSENTISLDPDNQVAEIDEGNNTVSVVLPVPTLPLPCTPTPTPPGVPGDVDCSGAVTSIDAALILQFGAALTDSLPCQHLADPNANGAVDAIDATLVLQFVAGLLGTL